MKTVNQDNMFYYQKAEVYLVWQVDGKELVPICLPPVPRHQAVLHLPVAAAVLVRGVQTPAARMDDPVLPATV